MQLQRKGLSLHLLVGHCTPEEALSAFDAQLERAFAGPGEITGRFCRGSAVGSRA